MSSIANTITAVVIIASVVFMIIALQEKYKRGRRQMFFKIHFGWLRVRIEDAISFLRYYYRRVFKKEKEEVKITADFR